MYPDEQMKRVFGKLKRLENMLEPLLFQKVDEVEMASFLTDGSHHAVPDEECFTPCKKGTVYEGEGIYCWFLGSYRVPEEMAGKTLFIYPRIKAYEGMLWVDGKPYGNFASKLGNHYCDMLKQNVKAGESIGIAMEYYAHHYVIGAQPFEDNPDHKFEIVYDGVDICLRDEEITDFYFNLRIVNQMVEVLPHENFRRGELVRRLLEVHKVICYDFYQVEREVFLEGVRKANAILKETLSRTNSASAPYAGLVGHSHMDTAWLWTRKETEKKCARTYANQMNLMDQYPDYIFVQSSAYHTDIIRRLYPDLFEMIKKRVLEGRYEPNGGVWIECDCNIPSGEYMVRQFLWGQRFTRKHFGYTSDAFWLPDTFGYSAALPQIMKGCDIQYFLTTKIHWNDTNDFPYDTFYWKGIDGSKVFVHFNRSHCWPAPSDFRYHLLNDKGDTIQEKSVTNMRLLSYGFGDGGGGPEFEMVEMANRFADVEGMPRTSHTTVSAFMDRLEKEAYEPSTYTGELYLELHRGALTNHHTIKRNNRKAEFALRDLEYLTVREAIDTGREASAERIAPLTEEMLVNQFHDILPGTCIPQAHDDAVRDVSRIIAQAQEGAGKLLEEGATDKDEALTAVNTLSFDREDTLYLPFDGRYVEGYRQQVVENLMGEKKLAVAGAKVPAFGSLTFTYGKEPGREASVFKAEGNRLETPFYLVEFDEKGYIASFIDKENGRQLRGEEGLALNTFLVAEDVSLGYDNWDLDADSMCKFADTARLLSREVAAQGAVEYRIRSSYQLTAKSTLTQDMVFYADRAGILFDTRMDWQDEHRFLKTAFDTSIHADYASHEIQFGYIRRSTTRNTSWEKARFEVYNHKYTDLSESRYGAALLNDCKYGISVEGGNMRLSLHKGGCRPDPRGDKGVHLCKYVFLPHKESLRAETVIRPAYMLNEEPLYTQGKLAQTSLVRLSAPNVIAETVKPMEDTGKGFILRLYEAEGTQTKTNLTFGFAVKEITRTNMLEETQETYGAAQEITLDFHPFEIKTLRVDY